MSGRDGGKKKGAAPKETEAKNQTDAPAAKSADKAAGGKKGSKK